jgi:hypothetical protein
VLNNNLALMLYVKCKAASSQSHAQQFLRASSCCSSNSGSAIGQLQQMQTAGACYRIYQNISVTNDLVIALCVSIYPFLAELVSKPSVAIHDKGHMLWQLLSG